MWVELSEANGPKDVTRFMDCGGAEGIRDLTGRRKVGPRCVGLIETASRDEGDAAMKGEKLEMTAGAEISSATLSMRMRTSNNSRQSWPLKSSRRSTGTA